MGRPGPRNAPDNGVAPKAARRVCGSRSAKTVGETARSLGLVAPTFRSPPRQADRDRSLRRRIDGSVCVAVRLDGRPFVAVQSDLIEGVLVANGLVGSDAESPRRMLWVALDSSGEIAPDAVAA